MKTSTVQATSSVEEQPRTIQIDVKRLIQTLAITLLISIVAFLIYLSFYFWAAGITIASYAAVRAYRFYKEVVNYDWSIEVADLTMEDVMSDLER